MKDISPYISMNLCGYPPREIYNPTIQYSLGYDFSVLNPPSECIKYDQQLPPMCQSIACADSTFCDDSYYDILKLS